MKSWWFCDEKLLLCCYAARDTHFNAFIITLNDDIYELLQIILSLFNRSIYRNVTLNLKINLLQFPLKIEF